MKKLLALLSILVFIGYGVSAQQAATEIIPKGNNVGGIVTEINSGGHVREIYKTKSNGNMTLGDQFASGVMNRDTILDYAAYLMKFIGQLALLSGAVMFIIYGYKKAIGGNVSPKDLGKVIGGILVVIFAYVIVRTIWYAFIA